ncbi:hypothetical protein [uncultured Methanobrevibacter sp.]|uniref:hypothetical protein n=1 Tax=uncultured Methanobrevibacter sp. TaxID=253161 RepID=UPI0025FA010C|nr:hypothetical protein [uncultured Methanobrevibacter sp.]
MNYKKFGIVGAIIIIICALTMVTAVSSTDAATDDGNCTLQINTTAKWRLDLTVDGNYSSAEGVGSKTINLNTTDLKMASVTVNQYGGGTTTVTLLKGNETLKDGKSNGDGIETIYFYYQAK